MDKSEGDKGWSVGQGDTETGRNPTLMSVIDTATADTKPGPERASDPAPVSRPMPADAPAIAQPQSQASQQTRVQPRNGLRWLPRFRWRAVSPLTRRIVAVEVLPLALLAVGFLYLCI